MSAFSIMDVVCRTAGSRKPKDTVHVNAHIKEEPSYIPSKLLRDYSSLYFIADLFYSKIIILIII